MSLESLVVRQMRKVAKTLAIKKVGVVIVNTVLNDLIKVAKTENEYIDNSTLENFKTSFLYDYFENGIEKCKSCGEEDSAMEMRGDICTNCY